MVISGKGPRVRIPGYRTLRLQRTHFENNHSTRREPQRSRGLGSVLCKSHSGVCNGGRVGNLKVIPAKKGQAVREGDNSREKEGGAVIASCWWSLLGW